MREIKQTAKSVPVIFYICGDLVGVIRDKSFQGLGHVYIFLTVNDELLCYSVMKGTHIMLLKRLSFLPGN